MCLQTTTYLTKEIEDLWPLGSLQSKGPEGRESKLVVVVGIGKSRTDVPVICLWFGGRADVRYVKGMAVLLGRSLIQPPGDLGTGVAQHSMGHLKPHC